MDVGQRVRIVTDGVEGTVTQVEEAGYVVKPDTGAERYVSARRVEAVESKAEPQGE